VGIGVNSSRSSRTRYNFSYTNPYFTEDGVSRGFNVFYRSTDLPRSTSPATPRTPSAAAINFGYPIKETERLGFSFGISNTEITAGRFAVQEIRSSPRLESRVQRLLREHRQPDGSLQRHPEVLPPDRDELPDSAT
jgi:outer membrane protein insertion porin family